MKDNSVKTILFFASNPKDTSPLRLHEEFREIEQGLKQVNIHCPFRLIQKGAARFPDIRRAMLEYQPEIVHFSGHGTKAHGILLEDNDGRAVFSASGLLADYFGSFPTIKCVFLNACYSEGQAEAFSRYIDYVIGVKCEITDRAAIDFSVAFYEAVATGIAINTAYDIACKTIRIQGCPNDLIPVLKLRDLVSDIYVESQPCVSSAVTSERDLTETADVILTINKDFDTYTASEQRQLLSAIGSLLHIDRDLTIRRRRRGSVELTIELSSYLSQKLCDLVKSGKLKDYGVVDAKLASKNDDNFQPASDQLIRELVSITQMAALRQFLKENPILLQFATDQNLTQRLNEAWSLRKLKDVRDFLAGRTFLTHCRLQGAEAVLAKGLDLPLSESSPIEKLRQLSYNREDLPERAHWTRRALDDIRRATEPDLWASFHRELADCLAQSEGPDRAVHLEEALKSHRLALEVWNNPPFAGSPMWAQTLHSMAETYSRRILGRQIDNLRLAIELYEKALTVRTKEKLPNEWAQTQLGLGKAWFAMPSPDKLETIGRSIQHFQNASSVHSQFHISASYELVNAWTEYLGPDRSANLEKAIVLAQDLLSRLSKAEHPLDWGRSQIALANAYVMRLQGSRTENVEKAINACTLSLEVLNPDQPDWAKAHYALALAYRRRPIGEKTRNLEKAIEQFNHALQIYTRTSYPLEWAHAQTGLGNIYSQPEMRTFDGIGLETAITCYQNALEIRTEEQDPIGWATIQNNLGNAYADRMIGDRADNQNRAIACYENALKIRTKGFSPARWAETMNNLGTIYIERVSGNPLQNQQQAIHYLKEALQVHLPELFPNDARRAARNLAFLLMGQGQWRDAVDWYNTTLTATEYLYQASATPIARQAELREIAGIPAHTAYALARQANDNQNALKDAVVVLEQNRARWLAESLALRSEKPASVPAALWQRFMETATWIQQLQNNPQQYEDAPPGNQDFLILSETLAAARTDLALAIEELRTYAPDFMPAPTYGDIQQTFASTYNGQVEIGIYLLTTTQGGLALIVHAGIATPVWLDALTDEMSRVLLHDSFESYNTFLKQRTEGVQGQWFAQLDIVAGRLWDVAIEPIAEALRELDLASGNNEKPPVVTLIPLGLLALLPLHAAWTTDSTTPTGRRYVLDDYAMRYAPSATALRHCRERASDVSVEQLLALDEPKPIRGAGSLPNSAREVKAIAGLFTTPTVLKHEQASRKATWDTLAAAQVAHFSCHGANNWQNPLDSGLLLANDELLTVRDFLELHLPGARLATLSACETGIVGTDLPDEVIMLPSALVQAGYAGVVASLWSVADVSTAMLMVRFYQFWREEGLEPVYALCAAQRWVRDTTNQEKADYFGQFVPGLGTRMAEGVAAEFFTTAMLAKEGPEARSFAHPFWWGAFYLTGI